MTWFLVDDSFAFHRKVIRAGNTAIGLWARAGSYSCQQLTDGVIERDMVEILGGTIEDAERLVDVELWEPHPAGYVFHKWPEKLTREYVQARRERNAVRMHTARSASDVRAHKTHSARVVQVPEPIRTEPIRSDSLSSRPSTKRQAAEPGEREPTLQQRRVLKARGAKSPAAVWRSASDDERDEIRKAALELEAPTRERCPEHGTELARNGVCSSCAADGKAGQ